MVQKVMSFFLLLVLFTIHVESWETTRGYGKGKRNLINTFLFAASTSVGVVKSCCSWLIAAALG